MNDFSFANLRKFQTPAGNFDFGLFKLKFKFKTQNNSAMPWTPPTILCPTPS